MSCILALDQGTTSSRAILFDAQARPLAVAQRELQQFFPQPGWVEHDPMEIWESQLAVACEVIKNSGRDVAEIAAIGITNQRETTVLWERASGRPLARAIVWQDRRTAEHCARLRADGAEQLVRERTGLVLDAYFSATKLAWLLDNVPDARRRAQRGELAFGTIDSWLMWHLSGGRLHVTDVSNASRTLLYDIRKGRWDPELLQLFGVPEEVLPSVRRSSEIYGETTPALLGASVTLGGMAGDQQAALFGQACHVAGMAKNTYGTGCFLLMHTGEQCITSTSGLITTLAAQAGDTSEYALEGSVFVAGAAVQWLRDGLGLIRSAGEVETLANKVSDTGGAYFVPALTGLGAPYWDPHARGIMVGLTRGTSAAHIARATLEAIAFQNVDLVRAIEVDARMPLRELRVDGGATANNLLLQIQADLLGVPVVRPCVLETTALGAAYLAGLAVGVWGKRSEIGDRWAAERVFEPSVSSDQAAARLAGWHRAVERSRGWAPS